MSTHTDHAIYLQVKTAFDRQNKYSTMRGYMLCKGMAAVQPDGSVKIIVGTYSINVVNGVIDTTVALAAARRIKSMNDEG